MSLRSYITVEPFFCKPSYTFKSAATKIAHKGTIPTLAGNPEPRSLQDLISAEKVVIVSYVSCLLGENAFDSNHFQSTKTQWPTFSKASEALKTRGLGEGDHLGSQCDIKLVSYWSPSTTSHDHLGHSRRIDNLGTPTSSCPLEKQAYMWKFLFRTPSGTTESSRVPNWRICLPKRIWRASRKHHDNTVRSIPSIPW